MELMELRAALEAILYVSDEPVTADQLAAVFPEIERRMLEEALGQLQEAFAAEGRGVILRYVAGGYRLSTRLEYHEYARRFLQSKPAFRLSMAALETLAIIAYRQPVTVPEILQIRGVKSTGAIKTLLEKKLIVARGRKKALGAPIQYGTSRDFLLHFGLGSLKELPTMEEFEEIFGEKAPASAQQSLFELKWVGLAEEGAAGGHSGADAAWEE